MKKAILCFSDEGRAAASLVAKLKDIPGETALWALGGLDGFAPEDTGADMVFEIGFANSAALLEPVSCARAILALFGGEVPDVISAISSPRGDALIAQFSLLTDAACLAGASALLLKNGGLVAQKRVYAGNLLADFAVQAPPLAVSLLPGGDTLEKSAPVCRTLKTDATLPNWLTDLEFHETEKANSLAEARIVVAAGRGAGNRDNLKRLDTLTGVLGGVLGGTRPVICDGRLPPERQLGLSGTCASPELCLVFGASGAAAFRAGIDGSKIIVAVNKDPDAPIFESSDFGVVSDSAAFASALTDALQK